MPKRFSAYFKIVNETSDDLTDIQVVLRTKGEVTYLFECGNLKGKASGDRHGIAIGDGIEDFWTVTYKRHGEIWWIVDKEKAVEKADAGKVIEIRIQEKAIQIHCPDAFGRDKSCNIEQPPTN